MDGPRFDTLARTLAATRRTSRKTLLGAGLGLLLAGHWQGAAADCKQVGQGQPGQRLLQGRSARVIASARTAPTAAAGARTSASTRTTAARATPAAAGGDLL